MLQLFTRHTTGVPEYTFKMIPQRGMVRGEVYREDVLLYALLYPTRRQAAAGCLKATIELATVHRDL